MLALSESNWKSRITNPLIHLYLPFLTDVFVQIRETLIRFEPEESGSDRWQHLVPLEFVEETISTPSRKHLHLYQKG